MLKKVCFFAVSDSGFCSVFKDYANIVHFLKLRTLIDLGLNILGQKLGGVRKVLTFTRFEIPFALRYSLLLLGLLFDLKFPFKMSLDFPLVGV